MLKNIIFCIIGKELFRELPEAMARLGGEGLRARAVLPGECADLWKRGEARAEDSLIVTDCQETADEAAAAGRLVVGAYPERTPAEEMRLRGISYAVEGLGWPDREYFNRLFRRFHGLPWRILETRRCIVREITVEDVDRLYEIYEDPSVTRYMEALYGDRERERQYTRDYIRHIYGFYGYGMWVVEEKTTGLVIGRAGLEHKEGFDGAELGYVIAAPYQRRGYALEVCAAILRYAGEVLSFAKVCSSVEPENKASGALCRRLGFRREGSRQIGNKIYDLFVRELPLQDGCERSVTAP